MSNQSGGGSELMFFVVMVICMMFLYDQVVHRDNYNASTTHQILQQQGISQKIENVENALKN